MHLDYILINLFWDFFVCLLVLLFCCCFVLLEVWFLCIVLAVQELRDPTALASQVLELMACATTVQFLLVFEDN